MKSRNENRTDRLFYFAILIALIIGAAIMLIPFLNVLATSLSSRLAVETGKVFLWPVNVSLASWKSILFERSDLIRSLLLSVFITVIGTASGLFFSSLMAYPLSKKEFKAGKYIMILVVITMIFRYPIIPYYLTLRNYGLYDKIWALILPHTIVAYNMILMRTFFRQLPEEVEESAKIEGCGYWQVLFRIVLPMSMPVLATVGLFYAVMLWDQYLHPLLFIENRALYPLQLKLREYLTSSEDILDVVGKHRDYNRDTLRAATVIFAALPIMMVYPFLQKYFVKGANLGAVKG